MTRREAAATSSRFGSPRIGSWRGRRKVFIGAPMSGFETESMYQQHRAVVAELCDELEKDPSIHSAYFAGRAIAQASAFNDPAQAFRADFGALAACDLFVLYYPLPVRSSVLVEVGIAIGLKKRCFLACRSARDLPYLLLNSKEAGGTNGIPDIDVWEWGTTSVDPAILARRVLETSPAFAFS